MLLLPLLIGCGRKTGGQEEAPAPLMLTDSLQKGFFIRLVIVDKLQQADITLLVVAVYPLDDSPEVAFQFKVGRTIQFDRLLQSCITGEKLRFRLPAGKFFPIRVLQYGKAGRFDSPVFLAMEEVNTVTGSDVFSY